MGLPSLRADLQLSAAAADPDGSPQWILADPVRSQAVDVIDVRYWAYTADDGLYAPNGGENLAPRCACCGTGLWAIRSKY